MLLLQSVAFLSSFTSVARADDYSEARQLMRSHKWAEAAIILRSIFRNQPELISAAIDLAHALVYTGRREEALNVLTDAISREKGGNRTALIRRLRVASRSFVSNVTFQVFQDGMNLLAAKKYRVAREKFERALHDEPANVEVLVRLGQTLVLEGDNDSASERLKLARRLNPFEPEVRLWLGRAMHQRGETNEAVEELRIAQAGLPGSELAPVWLAEALTSVGQRIGAIQILETDLRVKPFHLQSLLTLAQLRLQAGGAEKSLAIEARKDLQLAQSRLSEYSPADASTSESELGLAVRPSVEEIRSEIDKLFKKVEARLDELASES